MVISFNPIDPAKDLLPFISLYKEYQRISYHGTYNVYLLGTFEHVEQMKQKMFDINNQDFLMSLQGDHVIQPLLSKNSIVL